MVSRDRFRWYYPPSTGHKRPTERKFFVWKDRVLSNGAWRWLCTFCDPPVQGFRVVDGWEKIISESMPRHFAHRLGHHAVVALRKDKLMPNYKITYQGELSTIDGAGSQDKESGDQQGCRVS